MGVRGHIRCRKAYGNVQYSEGKLDQRKKCHTCNADDTSYHFNILVINQIACKILATPKDDKEPINKYLPQWHTYKILTCRPYIYIYIYTLCQLYEFALFCM